MRKTCRIVSIFTLLALMLAACGGGEQAVDPASLGPGDAVSGAKLFSQTCQTCHGVGGIGVEGLGKDMTHSEFIAGLSDVELLAFVKTGRSSSDPLNTTGIDMPAKGGNPALSDAQIMDIIAYIRTIHQ